MNMKKTLAGLMAGVVAISAMATVAVSAKAQEAKEITWSTMAAPSKSAESIVYVTLTPAKADGTTPSFKETDSVKLEWVDATATQSLAIDSITKITYRLDGSTSVDTEDLDRMYDVNAAKDTITFLTDVSDASATVELAIKIKSNDTIGKNSVKATLTAGTGTNTASAIKASNVKKDADETKKGVLINKDDNGPVGDTLEFAGDIVWVRDIDETIGKHMGKEIEAASEIADELADAKGATIAFNFAKEDIDNSVSAKEFEAWTSRYDWDSSNARSAISLRVNRSTKLSVDMMEFDKENFSAVYSWDEVMAQFQIGSFTGLVNQMGLKIDNSKLPKKKDKNEVIDLRLESITIKIPEVAETEDDTMIGDFAAGESATVVEDTLPAATDAPAATEAPATTDAAANPETGNSAVALLAIPAALAAAAIVAKKRG